MFRSTDEFSISLSLDGSSATTGTWKIVVVGHLTNANTSPQVECNIPMEKFPLDNEYGRYFKFDLISAFSTKDPPGGGLGYMELEYLQ